MDRNCSVSCALRITRLVVYLSILSVVSGCSTYYHKMDHVGFVPNKKSSKPGTVPAKSTYKASDANVHSLSIDAKQRIVFFTEREGQSVVCAEPSPDALSALSSNFSSSFQNNSNAIATLGSSISESATSIGLRTQSIQLLRDGMYRSCEAYAAGAIDEGEYNRQLRRYQNLMLSLLAIEQISGAVVAQPVALGEGKASGSVGESANDAAVELAQAEKDLESAQKALNDANSTQTTNSEACANVEESKRDEDATCTASKADAENVAKKQELVRSAELKRDNAKLKLQVARSSISTSAGGAKATFGAQHSNSNLTDESAKYVAEAARTIVSTTLIASFIQEECSRLWDFFYAPKVIDKNALNDAIKDNSSVKTLNSSSMLDTEKFVSIISSQLNVSDFNDSEHLLKKIQTAISSSLIKQKENGDESSPSSFNSHDIAKRYADAIMSSKYKIVVSSSVADLKEYKDLGIDIQSLMDSLISSCSESKITSQPILYTPQYPSMAQPLKILNSEKAKSLKVNDPGVSIQIIGGAKPYSIKNPEDKVDTTLKSGEILFVQRTKASTGVDDETTVFIMDAGGDYKEVKILLPK